MNMRKIITMLASSILLIIFLVLVYQYFDYIGLVKKPYADLPDRIRLFSYPNYIALIVTPVLLLSCVAWGGLQLFVSKVVLKKVNKTVWTSILAACAIISIVSFGGRFYLGQRVDNAGYIKCVEESRTSSKSSWRVYAKDVSLCKDSSGIAGA